MKSEKKNDSMESLKTQREQRIIKIKKEHDDFLNELKSQSNQLKERSNQIKSQSNQIKSQINELTHDINLLKGFWKNL